MTGSELIAAERLRQIQEEGWTHEHDSSHYWDTLADAGAAYALSASPSRNGFQFWPWDEDSWKPKAPLRDLVRAGALVAAAIDRYQQEAPMDAEIPSREQVAGLRECLAGAVGSDGNYVFEIGVRVPCDECQWASKTWVIRTDGVRALVNHCDRCSGRGWTAATDGWVWWRAALATKIPIWMDVGQYGVEGEEPNLVESWAFRTTADDRRYVWDHDPEAAFFTALTRALEAMGATLGRGKRDA